MPDFFKGEPLPLSLYPPNTDERKKAVGEFMQGKANIALNTEKLVEHVKQAEGKFVGVESGAFINFVGAGRYVFATQGPYSMES